MSQQLINHSSDLKRLRDEGYEVEVRGAYLIVHHVPYINSGREIQYGVLVSTLSLSSSERTAMPDTHVIHFIGTDPCEIDGSVITSIQHLGTPTDLNEGIRVDRSFSNRPPAGYPDYYQKIKRYIDIISAPAKYMDPSITAQTYQVIADRENQTVFQYIDTNSSRANIEMINAKISGQKVAIIGLGGTGSYILDLLAKTPVQQIHLYDADSFDQHNAFRSPGAASVDDIKSNMKKTAYFKEIYSRMHKNIHAHDYFVNGDTISELCDFDYVFISIDRNTARKLITDYLAQRGIPFSDVGLGVEVVEDKLRGAVRVTSASQEKNDHLPMRIFSEDSDDNIYATNIQIAELNSLNAALAVIKWKKYSGIYVDQENEHHSSYAIGTSKIFNEDAHDATA